MGRPLYGVEPSKEQVKQTAPELKEFSPNEYNVSPELKVVLKQTKESSSSLPSFRNPMILSLSSSTCLFNLAEVKFDWPRLDKVESKLVLEGEIHLHPDFPTHMKGIQLCIDSWGTRASCRRPELSHHLDSNNADSLMQQEGNVDKAWRPNTPPLTPPPWGWAGFVLEFDSTETGQVSLRAPLGIALQSSTSLQFTVQGLSRVERETYYTSRVWEFSWVNTNLEMNERDGRISCAPGPRWEHQDTSRDEVNPSPDVDGAGLPPYQVEARHREPLQPRDGLEIANVHPSPGPGRHPRQEERMRLINRPTSALPIGFRERNQNSEEREAQAAGDILVSMAQSGDPSASRQERTSRFYCKKLQGDLGNLLRIPSRPTWDVPSTKAAEGVQWPRLVHGLDGSSLSPAPQRRLMKHVDVGPYFASRAGRIDPGGSRSGRFRIHKVFDKCLIRRGTTSRPNYGTTPSESPVEVAKVEFQWPSFDTEQNKLVLKGEILLRPCFRRLMKGIQLCVAPWANPRHRRTPDRANALDLMWEEGNVNKAWRGHVTNFTVQGLAKDDKMYYTSRVWQFLVMERDGHINHAHGNGGERQNTRHQEFDTSSHGQLLFAPGKRGRERPQIWD
ncbi:hypothetical protein T439DRAFT_352500 [Meredithblackwellia eburnea MCA 4105]